MERTFEFIDAWFKMQTEFVGTLAGLQKDFLDNFIESSKKIQQTFLGAAGEGLPGKQMTDYYDMWFSTAVNSSRAFTDQIIKMQETWKASVNRQLDSGREMFRSFAENSVRSGKT